jgi:hypothetical protein
MQVKVFAAALHLQLDRGIRIGLPDDGDDLFSNAGDVLSREPREFGICRATGHAPGREHYTHPSPMLAGGHGALDQLPLLDLVVGAAGMAEPSTQERPRCARLGLFDLDGAQSICFKVDARGPDGPVKGTPCRPDSILCGWLPFFPPLNLPLCGCEILFPPRITRISTDSLLHSRKFVLFADRAIRLQSVLRYRNSARPSLFAAHQNVLNTNVWAAIANGQSLWSLAAIA